MDVAFELNLLLWLVVALVVAVVLAIVFRKRLSRNALTGSVVTWAAAG